MPKRQLSLGITVAAAIFAATLGMLAPGASSASESAQPRPHTQGTTSRADYAYTTATTATTALARRSHAARAKHALKAGDKAKLHYISASGATLYETGRATGTLPGSMHVRMVLGASFHGSFTIYTKGSSITGHGSAQPHGTGVIESFKGTLLVSGGTGRYKHASGRAALYGTFNRNSYALTIKTAGTLHY